MRPGARGLVLAAALVAGAWLPGPPARADSAAQAWARAMELSDRQQYDQALGVLREALARDPQSQDLRWLEAGVLGWSGRHAESVARYEALLAERPGLADEIRLELGRQRLWAGDPRGALRDAETELALHPESPEAARLRALALAHVGRHARALAAYDELLRREPADVELALDRATVLGWMGRNTQAAAAHEAILRTHPDLLRARIGQAQNENWRGNHARAAQLFEALIEEGHESPEVLEGLAFARYWADRPVAARSALERLDALRPPDRSARRLDRHLRFDERPTLGVGFEASDDSDDQRIETSTLSYRQPCGHGLALLGLVRDDRVTDPGGREDPLRFGVGVERRWADRWKAEGLVQRFDPRQGGGERFLGQAALAYRPGGRFQFDAGVEQEPVLTRLSLAQRIRATGAGVAVGWRVTDRWTTRAAAQYRDYSDGNAAVRASLGARATALARPRGRLDVVVGAEWLRTDDDLNNGYYDPESLVEAGPGLDWTTEWPGGAELGLSARVGYQKERDVDAETYYRFAATAAVPLGRRLRLGLEAGRSNSALSSASGFKLTRGAVYLTTRF